MNHLVDSGFMIGHYPISFSVTIDDFPWHKRVKVIAGLPPDYPNTLLKQEFEDKVAEVHLTLRRNTITVLFLRVYSSARTYLLNGQRPDLVEIQSTKGLGKAILCFGIQQAWAYFGENVLGSFSDLVIDLETNATHFYEPSEFDVLVDQNRYLSKNDIIAQLIAWFPKLDEVALYNELYQKPDYKLYKLFTAHKENHQLATYYQNTYGFEPVPPEDDYLSLVEDTSIVMEASASVIFQHCA
jgi:hypothetical protein